MHVTNLFWLERDKRTDRYSLGETVRLSINFCVVFYQRLFWTGIIAGKVEAFDVC